MGGNSIDKVTVDYVHKLNTAKISWLGQTSQESTNGCFEIAVYFIRVSGPHWDLWCTRTISVVQNGKVNYWDSKNSSLQESICIEFFIQRLFVVKVYLTSPCS